MITLGIYGIDDATCNLHWAGIVDLFDEDAVGFDGVSNAPTELLVGKVETPVGVLVVDAFDETAVLRQTRILTPADELTVEHWIRFVSSIRRSRCARGGSRSTSVDGVRCI